VKSAAVSVSYIKHESGVNRGLQQQQKQHAVCCSPICRRLCRALPSVSVAQRLPVYGTD
jgi:hypothetical protein